MRFKKASLYLLLGLTIVNGLIFIFRDAFAYEPYADYQSLYGSCNENCLTKWKAVRGDYPQEELKQAKAITDSIVPGRSTIEKVTGIGSFLYGRFSGQLGKPSEDLNNSSLMTQYRKLAADSVKLWCGNFAQLFSLFCWSQGIVTRTIEIYYPGDHHILDESYIPELQKWVMIDLTNNLILVQNGSGNDLDLVAFKKNTKETFALRLEEGSLRKQVIAKDSIPKQYLGTDPMYYYHETDAGKLYSPGRKLRRYFLPVSWYDIFDDTKHSNFSFYLKQGFSFLWLMSIFAFLWGRWKFKR